MDVLDLKASSRAPQNMDLRNFFGITRYGRFRRFENILSKRSVSRSEYCMKDVLRETPGPELALKDVLKGVLKETSAM